MLPYQFHYPLMNSLATTPVVPPPLQPLPAPERFRRSDSAPTSRCFELMDDIWSRQRPRQKVVVFKPCDQTSTSTSTSTTTSQASPTTRPATSAPTHETPVRHYSGRCFEVQTNRRWHPYVERGDPPPRRVPCPPVEPPPPNNILCERNFTLASYGLWVRKTLLVPCAEDRRVRRSTCEIL